MSITIQIERNSTATSGSVHVETDLVVLTASTSVPQEVDDAIMTFKNTGESPCQGYDAVKLLIETVLSSTGAPSAAVWFPAPEGGDGESQLHISGSVRVEGVRNGKRFTLACQGSPHTMVPNLTGCEELWVGLAGAERSVEMGRKRSSGVVGGSAFLVRPQDSLAPPQHQEPPAPAQPASPKPDPKPVAKPTPAPQPDPVQPKLNPTPAPPQPAASPTPAPAPDPVPKPETPPAGDHDSNKAQSEEDQVSLDSSTLLKVPTSGVPEAYLAPESELVDGIKCPNGHLSKPNPLQGDHCRWCGRRPAEGTRRLVRDRRPALGQIKEVSSGTQVPLTRSVVLGRAPADKLSLFAPGGRFALPHEPATMNINDVRDNISRAHALVRLDGWDVFVRDLGSLNGSSLHYADGRVVNLDANTEYPVKGPCRLMLHEVAVELNLF